MFVYFLKKETKIQTKSFVLYRSIYRFSSTDRSTFKIYFFINLDALYDPACVGSYPLIFGKPV